MNCRDWLMLACGLVGVGFILSFELQGAAPLGVVFGLLSGITFAGVVLSLRQLRGYESIWLVALNHLVTTIVLAPYVAAKGSWPHDEQWLYLAGLGILQMGIPYVLFAHGVRWITGHEASTILLLEPILVPLWVFVAWRNMQSYQAPDWWTWVGGGFILTGLLLRYAGKRQRIPGEKNAN